MADIIEVHQLTRQYGQLTAVDAIDFSVQSGDLFAFLGPNGAGKSTTINIICTLLARTRGEVIVDGLSVGRDDSRIRQRIGVVFQDNVLDDLLTIRENLLSRGQLYGTYGAALHDRLQQVARVMALDDILGRRYGKLSGGQKRRVEIARALMSDPKILFLDEPTTGLDPQTRILVWDAVHKLRTDLQMTIFLTTHYMEEAAGADQVSIIDNGRIVARGTPTALKEQYSSDILRLAPQDPAAVVGWCRERQLSCEQRADLLVIPVKDSLQALAILQALPGQFTGFEVVHGTMDDVFVNVTGHRIREDG